ncbi:HotDog domain-containing protein [Annulohypoxylon maeteangense]|uniref:HotDog domain-containing protein n=1 Tax=Annulohypoxylon maeteangense TaxID=1927788 RepID=UPI00200893A7|nr:HotDog domain-containing protein [Annulohypoxylon maeteangense]KAI0887207.1 HotDog domain-containing protein [Annulohypoxylon maeteangense]
MKVARASLSILRRSPCLGSPASRYCLPVWRRNYSTDGLSEQQIEDIRNDMKDRPFQWTRDYMSPTNSTLLNVALADFIPQECIFGTINTRSIIANKPLPEGHHFAYFPLQKTSSELCPDGTDPFHSPGDPFVRRMWAGGSIDFTETFRLNSRSIDCKEWIEDIAFKGPGGQEKIFATIRREYMMSADRNVPLGVSQVPRITERRSLVFMRGLSKEQARENLAKSEEGRERIVKSSHEPDYSFTFTPTPRLLFQYSALTFNAHSIHLDRNYCREVEGHRDLLVHGPLTLTLMLAAVRSRIGNPLMRITKIDYRNLAPLYVNEPLRVCVRLIQQENADGPDPRQEWEVWVEDRDGGLAVRGTAQAKTFVPRKPFKAIKYYTETLP